MTEASKTTDRIDAWRRQWIIREGEEPSPQDMLAEWGEDSTDAWRAVESERAESRAKMLAEQAKRDAAGKKAQDAQRRATLLRQAEIPARFGQARFDALDRSLQPDGYDACRAYCEQGMELDERPCLLLSGPPGTGKTTLAVACLHHVVDHTRRPVRFVNLSRFFQRLRDSSSSRDRNEAAESVLDLTAGWHLIVLDDLGRQRLTEWGEEQMYALLDTLYSEGRNVVFTTNVSSSTMSALLDEAVMSRLEQMCRRVVLIGDDLRKQVSGAVPEDPTPEHLRSTGDPILDSALGRAGR